MVSFIRSNHPKFYLMQTKSTLSVAAAATTDTTKLCSISNNSGIDVVVVMPLTEGETPDTNSIVTYDKDLEIPAASLGGNAIKNGITDTVTLNRTVVDPDTEETIQEGLYDLWVSTADWYSPINNLSVERDRRSKTFPAQTVSTDDVAAAKEAITFYQTISAYPNSKLAQDYVTAANASDPTDDSSTSPIVQFFAGTKGYTHVNLANMVAVEAYYESLVFGWAKYDSCTYYLYSSDGNTTSFEGKLVLTKPGKIDLTLANSGYTCQFVPAVTPTDTSKLDVDAANAKTLTYTGGQFVDDTTSDMPAISLKGSFQLKRTFTKQSADTMIIPVMSGTINGATCLGFDASQATTPEESDTQKWLDSLFNPKGAAQIFNSVMQILGALMMLHFVATTLYGIGKWIKNKASGTKPATTDDIAKELKQMREDLKAERDASFKKLSNNKDAEVPEDSGAAVNKATTEKASLSDEVSYSRAETTLDTLDTNLSKMEKFTSRLRDLNARVEKAGDDLDACSDKLDTVTPENMSTVMDEVRPQMEDLTGSVKVLNVDVQSAVADNLKADIQKDIDQMTDVDNAMKEENKTTEEEGADGENSEPEGEVEFPDVAV